MRIADKCITWKRQSSVPENGGEIDLQLRKDADPDALARLVSAPESII